MWLRLREKRLIILEWQLLLDWNAIGSHLCVTCRYYILYIRMFSSDAKLFICYYRIDVLIGNWYCMSYWTILYLTHLILFIYYQSKLSKLKFLFISNNVARIRNEKNAICIILPLSKKTSRIILRLKYTNIIRCNYMVQICECKRNQLGIINFFFGKFVFY